MPRLRAGVPERRAVRPPDRGAPGRRWPATRDHAAVAAAGVLACSAGIALLLAGSTLLAVAQRAPPGAAPARCSPALPLRRGRRSRRHRSTDVWLFTGCVMDAWLRETHRATARRARRHRRDVRRCRARAGRAAARCTSTPGSTTQARRLARRVMASMPGDAPIARQLGRLRRGAQGLRPPARHRRGARRSRPGWSTSTSGWRRRLDRARRRPRRRSAAGDRAGSVPPAPRAAGAPAGAHGARAASPTWSSSTTTACAAARAAPTRRCSPSSPATIRERKVAAIERAARGERGHGRGQRQPGLRDAPRRRRRRRCATRSTRDRRADRPARRGVVDELIDDLAERLERDRRGARRAVVRPLREAVADGGDASGPTTTRSSPRRAAAVEKAASCCVGLAQRADDGDLDER